MNINLIILLSLVFILAMAIDYITGTAVAIKKKNWSSTFARAGIWKKCGSIVCTLAAGLTDACLGLALKEIPSFNLPFAYTTLFSPLVIVWFTITEIGSIIENASKMGADIPAFLKNSFKSISKHDTDENPDE